MSAEALQGFVDRIERLNEEITGLTDDRKDVYNEAKSEGFDKKVLAAVIRRRAMERELLKTHDALLATYEEALANG